ncbi:MAG: prenyltransferase [Acidimicrobiales bacterium]
MTATRSTLPAVPGVITADEVAATAATIAELQLPDGMIPWFPGGHTDPWNHVESAMALTLAGRRAEAEAAYQWLADRQRPDGAWHNYYVAGGVSDRKFDANCVAYVAAGVWHHLLVTGDESFARLLFPVVDRALGFVLALQTRRGEIIWARRPDGTPWDYALLTGSSSIAHSLACGCALAARLGVDRPEWAEARRRLVRVIATRPDAFEPKERWAMDWYYPVLSGALTGPAARRRLAERRDLFLMTGKGVRCVSDQPWVTAAETCECAMAHLAVGDEASAHDLFRWAQGLRSPDGDYYTGIVHPERVHFPAGERSSYTAAAVILAADALSGTGPASGLFVDHPPAPGGVNGGG